MKKKYLYMCLIALMAVGTTGCEDRLDIQKHGNMGSQADFYKTDSEADEALASLYVTLRSNYYNWYYVLNLLSDDAWCGGGSRGDNASMEKLNEYNFGSDHGMLEGLYTGMYTIIYKANLIIDQMAPDTEAKKRAIAEAKVMRAFANFQLVTLWGTAPKVDHLLKPSEYRPGNSTPEELWAFVESDLNDAINANILPSKTAVNDEETGIRATKELAEALLGKALLFEGKYAEAAAMLDKVINSGKYDLFQGEYDQLLHAANNNNCEMIFDLQMRKDTEQAWNQFSMLHLMSGWRTDKLMYSGQALSEIAQGTYGFMNPRKSLYDAFVAAEGPDGYRLHSTLRTYEQLKDYGVSIQKGKYVYGNEGYFMWKTRELKADCIIDQSFFQGLQYTNMHVMRYAEVLLLAAEAHLQAGNQAKALTYVNKIRTRAKLPALTSVSLNDIKTEKRLELCCECVRYQDIIRWGDAKNLMAKQGDRIPSLGDDGVIWATPNTDFGFQDKNVLLPIPLKETELNPSIKQNDKW